MNMKTNPINTTARILFAALILFSTQACKDEEKEIRFDSNTESAIQNESEVESLFQSVESIVKSGMFNNESPEYRTATDRELTCLLTKEFSGTSTDGTLILTFDEDCIGMDGRTRSGTIEITFDGQWFANGSVVSVDLLDFYLDGVRIEGQLVYTNMSSNAELRFRVQLINGKVTWPDGDFASRNSDRIYVWDLSSGFENFEVLVEGEASGVTRDGTIYVGVTVEPLILSFECLGNSSLYFPVSGQVQLTLQNLPGSPEVLVDFGDGTCDMIVTARLGSIERELDFENRKATT